MKEGGGGQAATRCDTGRKCEGREAATWCGEDAQPRGQQGSGGEGWAPRPSQSSGSACRRSLQRAWGAAITEMGRRQRGGAPTRAGGWTWCAEPGSLVLVATGARGAPTELIDAAARLRLRGSAPRADSSPPLCSASTPRGGDSGDSGCGGDCGLRFSSASTARPAAVASAARSELSNSPLASSKMRRSQTSLVTSSATLSRGSEASDRDDPACIEDAVVEGWHSLVPSGCLRSRSPQKKSGGRGTVSGMCSQGGVPQLGGPTPLG